MSARPGPLQGIRVLELAHLVAGPICGMYLADMGADVIKVESRDAPDASRNIYSVFRGGEGILYLTANRNKRGISLDLRRPQGLAAFRRLSSTADVVLTALRGGAAERLGIGCESLRRDNRRLVYCCLSAFGPGGPWSKKPGLDPLVQAVGGLMAITGEAAGGPALAGSPVADTIGGLLAALGILTALMARGRTGEGQRVDASLLDGMILAQMARLSVFHETREPVGRSGSSHPELIPFQAFRASDDWIYVAVWLDRLWRPFCEAVGLAELADDPRFATRADRSSNRQALIAILEARLAERTVAEWMELLEKADVLCAPVNDFAQLVEHPQVLASGMITEQDHPRAGRFKTVATPVKLSATPGAIRAPSPALGEHTREVLAEAGFGPEEIERLETDGVIG